MLKVRIFLNNSSEQKNGVYDKFTSIQYFSLLLFYPYPYREAAKGRNFENPLYFAPLNLREYEEGLRGEKGIFFVHPY